MEGIRVSTFPENVPLYLGSHSLQVCNLRSMLFNAAIFSEPAYVFMTKIVFIKICRPNFNSGYYTKTTVYVIHDWNKWIIIRGK